MMGSTIIFLFGISIGSLIGMLIMLLIVRREEKQDNEDAFKMAVLKALHDLKE